MAPRTPENPFIAPTAIVDPTAVIGKGSKVWAFVQISEQAVVGENCVIGNGAYIDRRVQIGSDVRIHNKALLYEGVIIEDRVFIGPGVCFTNDPWPRSGSTRDMRGKRWRVGQGSVLGANVTVLPDISIGRYAFIAAGSVVTKPVEDFALMAGNPARHKGWVCPCGGVLRFAEGVSPARPEECPKCQQSFNEHLQHR